MLNFLGRSLGEDPEYHVEKDPRTPQIYENPVHTMELLLSDGAPSGADLSIQSHGKYYAVNTTGPLARQHHDCEVTGAQSPHPFDLRLQSPATAAQAAPTVGSKRLRVDEFYNINGLRDPTP